MREQGREEEKRGDRRGETETEGERGRDLRNSGYAHIRLNGREFPQL